MARKRSRPGSSTACSPEHHASIRRAPGHQQFLLPARRLARGRTRGPGKTSGAPRPGPHRPQLARRHRAGACAGKGNGPALRRGVKAGSELCSPPTPTLPHEGGGSRSEHSVCPPPPCGEGGERQDARQSPLPSRLAHRPGGLWPALPPPHAGPAAGREGRMPPHARRCGGPLRRNDPRPAAARGVAFGKGAGRGLRGDACPCPPHPGRLSPASRRPHALSRPRPGPAQPPGGARDAPFHPPHRHQCGALPSSRSQTAPRRPHLHPRDLHA
jgi:hypothetical protein